MPGDYTEFDRGSTFFLKRKFACEKQYAAHCHMIVKPCPLLEGFGDMLPQENLRKIMQCDVFW